MSLRAEVFVSLIGAMETALNQFIAFDPSLQKKLGTLSGKIIAIELESTPGHVLLCLTMLPNENGIELFSQYGESADTTLSGTPMALAKMSLLPKLAAKFGGDNLDCPDTNEVMFSGEVIIRGDIELGQRFRRILDEMDFDWEEHLSRLTGDIIAHKAGNVVRELGQWWQQAVDTLGRDASEFIQQESKLLPEAAELSAFMSEVDTLRGDLDRLGARIQRLSQ